MKASEDGGDDRAIPSRSVTARRAGGRRVLLPPSPEDELERGTPRTASRLSRTEPSAPLTTAEDTRPVVERALQRRLRRRAEAAAEAEATAAAAAAAAATPKFSGSSASRDSRVAAPSEGSPAQAVGASPNPKKPTASSRPEEKHVAETSGPSVSRTPVGGATPPTVAENVKPTPPVAISLPTTVVIRRSMFESPDFNADSYCNEMVHSLLTAALSGGNLGGGSPTSVTTPVTTAPLASASTSNVIGSSAGHSSHFDPSASTETAGRAAETSRPPVKGSDGKDLFSSTSIPMYARRPPGGGSGSSGSLGAGASGGAYLQFAERLSSVLHHALHQVSALQEQEERARRVKEVRGKRIEVNEKRRLASIRAGLEETTNRLQEYEKRIENAQAATAGIEQHLAQSNARVQRGKAVSQLLRHFRMLTGIEPSTFTAVLKMLGNSRIHERRGVTSRWEKHGAPTLISPPPFYDDLPELATETDVGRTSKSFKAATGAAASALQTEEISRDSATGRRRRKRVTRQPPGEAEKAIASSAGGRTASTTHKEEPSGGSPAPHETERKKTRKVVKKRRSAPDGGVAKEHSDAVEPSKGKKRRGRLSAGEEEETLVEEESERDGPALLRRAEAMAAAAGLDRLFIARSSTEAQVEWCQRLLLLAAELNGVAPNAGNIQLYANWLQQELVSDLFHVIGRFNVFYNRNPSHAAHLPLGRALLKTLELAARLYVTLTTSSDDLLTVFFTHAINDLGVSLHSDCSPTPFPGSPPPPALSDVLAMTHFTTHTEKELPKSFRFLVERVRREMVVVEAMVGANRTAQQQLLAQVAEKVIKPFIAQQIKLAEKHRDKFLEAEAELSPRSKRRSSARVVDAITYYHTVAGKFFTFLNNLRQDLMKELDTGEADCLDPYCDAIFYAHRDRYGQRREELELMRRAFTLIEEKYTRALHPMPEELFDLREAHMTKTRAMMDVLVEAAARVRTFALERDTVAYTIDVIRLSFQNIIPFFETELKKTLEAMKLDKEKWRLRPKTEEDLLKPKQPESQHCSFRMLLFVQTGLIMLQETLHSLCRPLLHRSPRLGLDVEKARSQACASLDDTAEKLLNFCVNAILIKSLSILQHYQVKSDFLPTEKQVKSFEHAVAPPCTRACTLFCYYITRQLGEAKEFIHLSEIGLQNTAQLQVAASNAEQARSASPSGSVGRDGLSFTGAAAASLLSTGASPWRTDADLARARARAMSRTELLYGDGEPSTFVRTLGVCLFRGIAAHLKGFVANDHGALVYKQDVTAYAEAMRPLSSSPTLGGAVVGVLFQMLRETSSLLLMPLDHIKEVKDAGLLQLMGRNEKLAFLKIRQDVRTAFKAMHK